MKNFEDIATYEHMVVKAKPYKKYARGKWYNGIYIDGIRINPSSVPSDYHMYQCRHSDNGDWCTPVTIEKYVVVNFAGTFLCKTELPIGDFPDGLEIQDYHFEMRIQP